MSFQAGGATDANDLINQFATFLVAAGWTVDANNVQNTGRILYVTKGVKHFGMRSFINENLYGAGGSGIGIVGYDTYAAPIPATNWWNQAGAPFIYNASPTVNVMTAVMVLPAGAITQYWMFADTPGDNVVLVAFKQANVYSHLYFGDVAAANTLPGINPGRYFGASSSMFSTLTTAAGTTTQSPPPGALGPNHALAFLKVDVDSFTGKWLALGSQVQNGLTTGKRFQASTGSADESLSDRTHIYAPNLRAGSRSTLTGALMPMPTHWLADRDNGGTLTGGGYSYVGYLPWIYMVAAAEFVPGSDHAISTDHYAVFPNFCVRKF